MISEILVDPLEFANQEKAEKFCHDFISQNDRPKFLFGRNIYAKKILEQVDVDGFVDDYASENEHLGKPIMKLEVLPPSAMVLVLSGGRPMSALKRVEGQGFETLDYFAFLRFSGLDLTPVLFMNGHERDYSENLDEYGWVYSKLADDKSRTQFVKLMNFKNTLDISHLAGFEWAEDRQYFEEFLGLCEAEEVFADVGSYDGFTSQTFALKCPEYYAIHVFEPDPANMVLVRNRLSSLDRVFFHPVGLSDRPAKIRMCPNGSQSTVNTNGPVEIEVDRLSNVLDVRLTFIKMDIEGAETEALDGARDLIVRDCPKLAISAYHKPGDFWRIPRQILSMREDYSIYLRHYTESIYETVMFFVPVENNQNH